jgi:predicted metalloendopeptidase
VGQPLAIRSHWLFATCWTTECAAKLKAMPYSPSLDVTSLDRSVDPCVDFYKFSCGGWEKNNPIPVDQAGWSVYAKLANENQQFLWGILEDDAQGEGSDAGAAEGGRLLCRLHEYGGDRRAGRQADPAELQRLTR